MKFSFSATRAIWLMLAFFATLTTVPLAANSSIRVNLQMYNTVFRGQWNTWYYGGTGLADIRFASSGNANIKAAAALDFFPEGGIYSRAEVLSEPVVSVKRLWFKANFPTWRLTGGKTKVAWGNGFVFNSGDILFGSRSPFLDFTQSAVRDDTAFLVAFNVPLDRFSYIEGVVLPPNLIPDGKGRIRFNSIEHTSGGIRFFTRLGGIRIEGGYLYKTDAKVANDLLGHRPYLSFHGHAGIDLYGAVSMAAGPDPDADDGNRNTWEEIAPTFNMSFGIFHQVNVGYEGTLAFRFETLIMPWQNWVSKTFEELLKGNAESYGILLYPEMTWNFRKDWTMSIRSIISPVDESAQLTGSVSWNVLQGFTLLTFFTFNIGDADTMFAWDRSESWLENADEHSYNGIGLTVGARYNY